MKKSRQNSHEYYANAETCRNLWFNMCDPDIQIEDEHLNYEKDFFEDEND